MLPSDLNIKILLAHKYFQKLIQIVLIFIHFALELVSGRRLISLKSTAMNQRLVNGTQVQHTYIREAVKIKRFYLGNSPKRGWVGW